MSGLGRSGRYSSLSTRWLAADPALLIEAKATHGLPLGSAKSLWLSLELLAIFAAQLTAAFSSVGAFALTANSRDAALIITLPAGTYTAQVSGVNNTTGVAIVEVYDLP